MDSNEMAIFQDQQNKNRNHTSVLGDPTSDKDTAIKRYVDVNHITIDNKLSTLRVEYDVHINVFTNLRRKF